MRIPSTRLLLSLAVVLARAMVVALARDVNMCSFLTFCGKRCYGSLAWRFKWRCTGGEQRVGRFQKKDEKSQKFRLTIRLTALFW
jgi:hypothetical protein